MRQAGATLQQIADEFGFSRERARQLLSENYGSTRVRQLLTTSELVRLARCTPSYIDKLKRRGIIAPAMVVGRRTSLWQPEAIATIIIYIDRHGCLVCQRPVPGNRQVYCSRECYLEAQRYRNRPVAVRKRQQESTARWTANHPEQAKEIERRKAKKYRAKKSEERYRSTQYIILRKCPIPLGTVVKVVSGNKNGRLNVEWGDKILEVPFGCVRKLEKN